MKTFHNDDPGYEAWIAGRDGYVLTRPRAGHYMMHTRRCAALLNFRNPQSMTRKPRRWSESFGELQTWANDQPGYVLDMCLRCAPMGWGSTEGLEVLV